MGVGEQGDVAGDTSRWRPDIQQVGPVMVATARMATASRAIGSIQRPARTLTPSTVHGKSKRAVDVIGAFYRRNRK